MGSEASWMFHTFFWYTSGSLRMRKILPRRPSCPAEHSRQGYSGSHYSNKVCDINRADVKSLLTLYTILWEYMSLGHSHASTHIPSHGHHQLLVFIPAEHYWHLSQTFVSSFLPAKPCSLSSVSHYLVSFFFIYLISAKWSTVMVNSRNNLLCELKTAFQPRKKGVKLEELMQVFLTKWLKIFQTTVINFKRSWVN